MNLIVAVSKNYGIGKDNKLLFNLPSDLRFFKEKTSGGVVVMGKNTYMSLPKRPLPNRVNIVLSKDPAFEAQGAVVVRSLSELFAEVKKYEDDKIFVCGGSSIYNLLMPYCENAYVTVVDEIVPADTFIDDVEKSGFTLESASETICENNHSFRFNTYKNTQLKNIDEIDLSQ